MAETLRLLAVFPHPDDETMGMGGTMAKYSSEGVETHLICATHGERGWTGPEDQNPGFEEMRRIREIELRSACAELGVSGLTILNYIDGDVDQAEPKEIIGLLTTHIRRVRPHVMVTFGPDGIYGHPDHIALAQFTAAALLCSADGNYSDPEERKPYTVPKLYNMVVSLSFMRAFEEAVGDKISIGVDGVERSHPGWEEWAVTSRIDTTKYADQGYQALLCHKSQLPSLGSVFEKPPEVGKNLFREGQFIRIYSLVNGGRKLENDLFEGLR